jgi:hypothetical protein
MVIISIVIYFSRSGCSELNAYIDFPMLNPFTFYFMNSTLNYFVCPYLSSSI